jgi:hypothetical protein
MDHREFATWLNGAAQPARDKPWASLPEVITSC